MIAVSTVFASPPISIVTRNPWTLINPANAQPGMLHRHPDLILLTLLNWLDGTWR